MNGVNHLEKLLVVCSASRADMEGRDSHTHPKPQQETTISAATFGGAPFMPVTNTHLLERQQ